jgi:hypothetical protein
MRWTDTILCIVALVSFRSCEQPTAWNNYNNGRVVFSFPDATYFATIYCFELLPQTFFCLLVRAISRNAIWQSHLAKENLKLQQASEIYWKCEIVRFTGSQSNLATWRLREIQDWVDWYLTVLVGGLVCGPVGAYSGAKGYVTINQTLSTLFELNAITFR